MEQLIEPNLNASDTVGYCERFAERVWGAPKTYLTATAGYNAIPAQYRHIGDPPAGIYVQMYWAYQADGHTATSLGDGRILSSPWEAGTTQAILSSRTELEQKYSTYGELTYLGWTEYFNGVLVALEDNMEVMTKDAAYKVVTYLYNLGTGGSPTPDQGEYWATRMTTVLTAIDELGVAMEEALAARMAPAVYIPYAGQELYTKNS